MIDKKMGVWLAASAGVVLVAAGAIAVAATDWGPSSGGGVGYGDGGGRAQVRATRTASAKGAPGRRSYRGSSNRFLLRYDADHDGRITRAEIDAGIVAQFRSIDTNHDGRIDAAEYQAYEDGRRAARRAWREAHPDAESATGEEPPPSFDPMKRLDWNLDGFVSLDEFGGRERALAMRADRDGDGAILADDLTRPATRRTASAR